MRTVGSDYYVRFLPVVQPCAMCPGLHALYSLPLSSITSGALTFVQDHAEEGNQATTWQMVLKSAQLKQFQSLDANGNSTSPSVNHHCH